MNAFAHELLEVHKDHLDAPIIFAHLGTSAQEICHDLVGKFDIIEMALGMHAWALEDGRPSTLDMTEIDAILMHMLTRCEYYLDKLAGYESEYDSEEYD